MDFSFDLNPRDLLAALMLQLGGWRGIAGRAAVFATQVAFAVYAALLLADLGSPRMVAVGVVWVLVFGWLLVTWYRYLRPERIAIDRAWMFVPRSIALTEFGVESTAADQVTRHAWSLVRHIVVTPEVIYFHCASDLLIVLPGRAIPDRPAFLEFIRTHYKGPLTAKECPICGYDISRSSGACPECGIGSSGTDLSR